MQLKGFKNIRQLAADQFSNFEESARLFPDILQWAERIKEFIAPRNMLGGYKVVEYTILMHLAVNAFLNSLINEMKLHHFHARAIARIGVDAILNKMAVIEVDFEKHLSIWKDNQSLEKRDADKPQYAKEYKRIFEFGRADLDYSSFMGDEMKSDLKEIWRSLSSHGSHPSFISSAFSIMKMSDEEFISGAFDYSEEDPERVGLNMATNINTFFLLSRVATAILERHGQKLRYSLADQENVWNEWHSHKMSKAKEWGIPRDYNS